MNFRYQLNVAMKARTGTKNMFDDGMATLKNDPKRQLQVISCRNDQKILRILQFNSSIFYSINQPELLFGFDNPQIKISTRSIISRFQM